ncbi:hypothetical protein BpHYR1_040484 [Brachionus plicatilis]|uniref:Uncharacterized protein n=1 Tax=Brachionus plicatilis TaxID=10195 RepID=A0A3M7T2S7_BRAPC|nr:hypothetical protein BpHYR1_040484 [Brachionus plicatilis]
MSNIFKYNLLNDRSNIDRIKLEYKVSRLINELDFEIILAKFDQTFQIIENGTGFRGNLKKIFNLKYRLRQLTSQNLINIFFKFNPDPSFSYPISTTIVWNFQLESDIHKQSSRLAI